MPFLRHHTRTKLRESLPVALTILCLPCICILGLCVLITHCYSTLSTYELPSTRKKREIETQERDARRRIPFVLASRIERDVDALSLRDSDSDSDSVSDFGEEEEQGVKGKCGRKGKGKGNGKERKTHWQEQSPLFNLPLEIRNRVYEECIGGYTIHISTLDAYHRMAHTRCETPFLPTVSSNCACGFLVRQEGVADEWGNTSLLHLLVTCRRMYVMFRFSYFCILRAGVRGRDEGKRVWKWLTGDSCTEAVDVLYRKNTFTFSRIGALVSHLLNIPPQRIPVMRDVRWK
jgi:hypothetical protein